MIILTDIESLGYSPYRHTGINHAHCSFFVNSLPNGLFMMQEMATNP